MSNIMPLKKCGRMIPITYFEAVETDVAIVNASFEEPVIAGPVLIGPDSDVPGWSHSDGNIELWRTPGGNPNITSFIGDQNLELDSSSATGQLTSDPIGLPAKAGELRLSITHTNRRGGPGRVLVDVAVDVDGTVTSQTIGQNSGNQNTQPEEERWATYEIVVDKPLSATNAQLRLTANPSDLAGPNRSHLDNAQMVFWCYEERCGFINSCSGKVYDKDQVLVDQDNVRFCLSLIHI